MIDHTDDTFKGDEPKSSSAVLLAISKAEDAFRNWQVTCQVIDEVYSLRTGPDGLNQGYSWHDAELDLFWSSFEILKPAVYARPPQPVVAPLFKDGKPLYNTTAELLERCAISTFKNTGINEVMINSRDDLIFAGRGTIWLRHDVEKGMHKVCVEHKDRLDFLHEPCRYWSEVGWVAGAAWLTKKEMRKRFSPTSGEAYMNAQYGVTHDERDSNDGRNLEKRAQAHRCKVWEVWHKADNRVYWVTEGVNVYLDESEPHLDLEDFFPCPKPAYATLQRRSLIPTPDYERYAVHFDKISELTRRIYALLDRVRMKGMFPAGGDVGDALEQLLSDDRDDTMLVPVSGASLTAGGGDYVQWIPLDMLAATIQGLIDSRNQLIQDFFQLSGISDIMRGATEAEETLGAQQLKSQYGSVRVREKSAELQRMAADAVKIASEIIAEKFPQKQLLEMSMMDIPTKKDIADRIKKIEEAARAELEDIARKAQEAAQQAQQMPPGPEGAQGGQGPDPAQAEQMMQQAQQQVLQKYAPMLAQTENEVPIEDVVSLLRDDRARCFAFEIESSSTILTDEMQEKASRNEFLAQFSSAMQSLTGLAAMGEAGAELAGEVIKFTIAPYRAGRSLDGAIEKFIDQAPQMAKAASAESGEGEELVEANKMLADAEMAKAQAAMKNVEAKAMKDQAENQRKMAELQLKAQTDGQKAQQESDKLRLQLEQMGLDYEKQQAEINKLTAETAKILASIGLDERKQELSEYQAAEQAETTRVNQAMQADNAAVDQQFRAQDGQRAEMESERSNERADRQQDFTEQNTDRQQSFTEQQAQSEPRE